jgi:tRNA-Thr(GGU) m(6)t(6)A37 methyltransferase TsaA
VLTMALEIKPIVIIHTPLISSLDCKIQSRWSDVVGEAQIFDEYLEGLESLSGFSHIILLYWFHRAKQTVMRVRPYLDSKERGVFSTRAPIRPNPIGLSVVKLLRIDHSTILFEGADMFNESPLINIKPFVPQFDNRLDATSGWLSQSFENPDCTFRADERFEE